ncbi:MAG: hypothetical protein WBO57_12140, partial [Gammaproteobacteria bacterium]
MNTWITSFFGMGTTWSENLRPLGNTTTRIGFINRWPEMHRRLLAVFLKLNAQISTAIPGYHTATDFFKPRSLHKQEFAKDTLAVQY